MINRLLDFLETSYTAYHAVENAKQLLLGNGFIALSETDDWAIEEGGKYFVERNGSSLVAFTVGALDDFSFKIVASHTDSPALKLKENAVTLAGPMRSSTPKRTAAEFITAFRPTMNRRTGRNKRKQRVEERNRDDEYLSCLPSRSHEPLRQRQFASIHKSTCAPFRAHGRETAPDFLVGLTERRPSPTIFTSSTRTSPICLV
ncbi:MAG: hypothetical protein ACLS4Z_04025 [Christensenellaceae bacterium]